MFESSYLLFHLHRQTLDPPISEELGLEWKSLPYSHNEFCSRTSWEPGILALRIPVTLEILALHNLISHSTKKGDGLHSSDGVFAQYRMK